MKGQTFINENSKRIITSTGSRNQAVSIEIEGLDELCEAFSKLGEQAIFKLAEPSSRGAHIICNRAKARVNYDESSEEKHIQDELKVVEPGENNKYTAFGQNTTKKAYTIFATITTGKAYHASRVELGHKLVRNGKTIGTVKEHPFLRPAADESKNEVDGLMINAMTDALNEMEGLKYNK